MNIKIEKINILADNYVWLIINQDNLKTICIDPGEYQPVKNVLDINNLQLTSILITHHHWDHTDGVIELSNHYGANVIGPKDNRIKNINYIINEESTIDVKMPFKIEIIFTPGHTSTHISYYIPELKALFPGDTIFSAGCGRIFEGTYEVLFSTLNKINKMPSDTHIYCAHEYTMNNLKFANMVNPKNRDLKLFTLESSNLISKGKSTIPTKLSTEKKINPFLRTDDIDIIESVKNKFILDDTSTQNIFKYLRLWKDTF